MSKKSKQKKQENYLDFVYMKNPDFTWRENDRGMVVVDVKWEGFFHKIAQKFFSRPKTSEIALDNIGSFVWPQLDGNRSLYEVAENMKAHFGKDIEPVYRRLFTFIGIMKDNRLIVIKGIKPGQKKDNISDTLN